VLYLITTGTLLRSSIEDGLFGELYKATKVSMPGHHDTKGPKNVTNV